MIPLHDDNPTRSFPWVTIVIIGINVAAFAFELSLGRGVEAFVAEWAFTPARFFSDPFSLAQIATIFVSMFLHAGWLHIGGNMLYLWIFGNNIEDRLGPLRFIAFYLTAGIVATLGQGFASLSLGGANIPNIGASGAIAGVLGAYLILYPRARVLTAVIIILFIELVRIPALIVIGLWFVLQLASSVGAFNPVTASQGGVAYFAHISGFVAGMAMALPLLIADRTRRTRFVGWR